MMMSEGQLRKVTAFNYKEFYKMGGHHSANTSKKTNVHIPLI